MCFDANLGCVRLTVFLADVDADVDLLREKNMVLWLADFGR
jgi:hypothetical protein